MGNGIRSFFRKPLVQGVGASVILAALVMITSFYSGGEIDCGNPTTDHIEIVTSEADFEKHGVQVVVCIVDGKNQYDIEQIEYDDDDPDIPDYSDTRFEVIPYFVNFKIKDKEGNLITKFDRGIEISFLYTEKAVQKISEAGYITPRVAILASESGNWLGGWEEIGGTVAKKFGPEYLTVNEYELMMVFKLWALPDPLIGGC